MLADDNGNSNVGTSGHLLVGQTGTHSTPANKERYPLYDNTSKNITM
jgi:hypothetical protein